MEVKFHCEIFNAQFCCAKSNFLRLELTASVHTLRAMTLSVLTKWVDNGNSRYTQKNIVLPLRKAITPSFEEGRHVLFCAHYSLILLARLYRLQCVTLATESPVRDTASQ